METATPFQSVLVVRSVLFMPLHLTMSISGDNILDVSGNFALLNKEFENPLSMIPLTGGYYDYYNFYKTYCVADAF